MVPLLSLSQSGKEPLRKILSLVHRKVNMRGKLKDITLHDLFFLGISSQDLASSYGGIDKRSVLLTQVDYMTRSL